MLKYSNNEYLDEFLGYLNTRHEWNKRGAIHDQKIKKNLISILAGLYLWLSLSGDISVKWRYIIQHRVKTRSMKKTSLLSHLGKNFSWPTCQDISRYLETLQSSDLSFSIPNFFFSWRWSLSIATMSQGWDPNLGDLIWPPWLSSNSKLVLSQLPQTSPSLTLTCSLSQSWLLALTSTLSFDHELSTTSYAKFFF